MVKGEWKTEADFAADSGEFVRKPTTFRDRVQAGGDFPPVAGRYHLYVSYACPWAHRTLIVRALKGLQDAITVSIVDPVMGSGGWKFGDAPGSVDDTVNGAEYLREIYALADSEYTGRVTVPVLWDQHTQTIVNNESREIIEMLDLELDDLAADGAPSFYPEALRGDIDAMIDANYGTVNNGVYKAGFAGSQQAYERAVRALFARLDRLEVILGETRFLCGDALTAADVCLFTTLFRFDPVYNCHFKCNVRRIVDYPNLWGFVRDVYQTPGVAETCNLDHIKVHYYCSHETVNPRRLIPLGPEIDYTTPHGRG